MKKWKHLLKAVMTVGVIAMTAVQICTAAEGTAQAAVSDVISGPAGQPEISLVEMDTGVTSETAACAVPSAAVQI